MKGLLFLARVALICNIFFLACFTLARVPNFIDSQAVAATMIVLGVFLAPFVNFASVLAYLIARMRKRVVGFPVWLVITNLLFLVFEVLSIIFSG